jgi:hypothetical protein
VAKLAPGAALLAAHGGRESSWAGRPSHKVRTQRRQQRGHQWPPWGWRVATMMPDSSPPIIASNFKWVRKNTLWATADIEDSKWRLKIRGVMWHAKNGKDWLFFPSHEWVDRDGARQFTVLLEFTDRDVERRFKDAPMAAIRAVDARGGL